MRVSRKPTVEALIARLARGGFAAPATPFAVAAPGGFVTALPAAPSVGDTCYFIADKADGIIWHLVYDGEGIYPWKKIGGPPLSAGFAEASASRSAATYASPTGALSVTAPLAGDYDITIQGQIGATFTAGEFKGGYLSYAVGATAANDNWAARESAEGWSKASHPVKHRHTGIPKSAKVEEKIRCTGFFEVLFEKRSLWINPVRVG